MKLSVAIAGAIFLLASLTACIGDRSGEAVNKFIEDAKEDALGTPTPQSGGVPAPPARSAPPDSSGATGPKIEPAADSGPTVTPQSTVEEAEGGSGRGESGTSASFLSVSAGWEHTCGVRTDGSVACWGSNGSGQSAPPAGSFTSVSGGHFHTCGVRVDGTVACWGSNGSGQSAPPAGSFASVSAGYLHTCGVREDGFVACWGSNEDYERNYGGQATPPEGRFVSVNTLGIRTCGVREDGSVTCWGDDSHGAATPPAGRFASVSVGGSHTCGVRDDGTVACWGSNSAMENKVVGQATPPEGRFASVSAGNAHTCGVRDDGAVACWGFDQYGQASPPEGRFVSVSAGIHYTCGVRDDGAVACWGFDQYGQASPPEGRFVSVSAGLFYTCGVRDEGSISCWGRNHDGEATPPEGRFASVSAGEDHACGMREDGSVACWGNNWNGKATTPEGRFSSISAGEYHTCGVREDGPVECWGSDKARQAMPPEGRFLSVSAGLFYTCGVRDDGSVSCWGFNEYGEATSPEGRFASVSAGGTFPSPSHTCGVRDSGSVACWGSNELPEGKYVGQATPPEGRFSSVSAGGGHTCGVRDDGSVACWGLNNYGQSTPPEGRFSSVNAGAFHACGIRDDGSVACWGSQARGLTAPSELDTSASSSVPVPPTPPRGSSESSFRIGVLESLTGPGETWGTVAVQAKQLAVDEINEAGGINGRTLALIVEDSQCSAGSASSWYNKLTDVDEVKIILGTTCSGAMLGVAPLAEEDGVVLFSGSASHPDIFNAGDYIFRTAMSDAQVGIDTGNVMWADGIRSLATITEATDYAEGVRRTSVDQFRKLGGHVAGEESFASEVFDFRTQLRKLLGTNPDALHIAAQSGLSGGAVVKQVRELGYEGPIYSDFVSVGSKALEIAGEAATGMRAIVPDLDPTNKKAQKVLKNFREKYGYVTLPWYLGSAYDVVYIAAECLKKTDDDQDADGFRDCLYEITWSGTIGHNYSFDENGEVIGLSNVVVVVLPLSERTETNQGYEILGSAPISAGP